MLYETTDYPSRLIEISISNRLEYVSYSPIVFHELTNAFRRANRRFSNVNLPVFTTERKQFMLVLSTAVDFSEHRRSRINFT